MNIRRVLGLVLVGAVLATACDDTTPLEPPPTPPQITHGDNYYTKTFENGVQTGLQDNDVFDMLVDSSNRMWIGNQAGVAVYPNLTSLRRSAAYDQNNGLPNPKVRRLLEHDGKIYVATWGGGVGIYDITADSWRTLNTSQGLSDNLVSDIETDGTMIYFATNNGVTMYDPVADTTDTFDPLEPLVSVIEIADTPRGREWWYGPRVEFGIDPGTEGDHGITLSRRVFNARPDTVFIQPTKDNTIYEPAGDLSNGQGQHMWAGTNASGIERRGLIAFDIAGSVPARARIISAQLTLRCTRGSNFITRVSLYRATSDWGEGSSLATGDERQGAPAQTGDATWINTFYPTQEWVTPGGDFPLNTSARISVRDTAFYNWISPTTASDVKRWLDDPSTNKGWVILSEDSTKRYASRQHTNPAFRPVLRVIYSEIQYMTPVDSDLPEPDVNDIFYDSDTDLFWVALATEGLATVDLEGSKWTFFTTSNGLPSNYVHSIAKVNGTMWVATQNGIARQRAGGSWQGYDSGGGLKADRVRRLYPDIPTRMWLSYVQAGAGVVFPQTAE